MERNNWSLITDVPAIEDLCRIAIGRLDANKIFHKYLRGEHKRPKNKKTVGKVVSIMMELSQEKVHTRIAQTVARDMLDDRFMEFTNKKPSS